jgi:5-methylcytosine-specific restriction endonuclease McrA
VARPNGKMTAAQAYHRLTRVNGQKFMMPTAYTPEGKLVSLLAHSRFRRVRFHRVQGANSPLDPRLGEYWEERRTRALLRRVLADARGLQRYLLRRQQYRCAITGLPLEDLSEVEVHHFTPKEMGGNDGWSNLALALRWAHQAVYARRREEGCHATLKDVPFSGV